MKTEFRNLLIVICMLISFATRASEISIPLSPVTFLKNKGQWQPEIFYQSTSTSTSVYFLRNGLSFAQSGEAVENEDGTEDYPYLVWNMKFINQSSDLKISGTGGKKSVVSYLSGNDSTKWVIHPEEYSQLNYQSIFKNIDLHFYGNGNELKYDYIIHKGGDVNSIKAFYEGINSLAINANNELEINTAYNVQLQKKPIAWQIINGVKQYVEVNYVLLNDTTFGFKAEQGYNKNYDLIIDPLFQIVWSSYTKATGASNNINYCFSNAMDNAGNVYLTGMVDGSFPITPGAYSGPGNIDPEIFVAKFSSDGSTLLYSTYLPGNSSEHGIGIAVDDLGRAYVTGVVDLNITGITNFPSTANAYQPVHSSGSDAFLTVLNPTGTSLVYSSFLGGTGGEMGYDIALGSTGIAYITGNTSSTNFPIVASSAFPTGSNDMFVSKFDINQSGVSSLVYSTKIGGGSFNNIAGRSIAVNSAGNAFITGTVYSSSTLTFPTTAGVYATVYNSGQDNIMSFVTKISATTPVTLSYSTLLTPGIANAIAVDDATGDAFIVGTTYTFAFPITAGALQPVHAGAGGTDAFALRLNATGSSLIYSTFIGGNFYDEGTGLAINSAGEAYVAGIAQDLFPTSPGSFQPNNAGTYDFFVVHVNASGTAYGCGGSTYVGGSDADYTGSFYDYAAPQVSIRDHGGNNDTISVSATSHSQDFPTTPGVYGPLKMNGIADQPVFFKLSCASTAVQPVANFSSNSITICDSVRVNFIDSTLNNPISWQWSFPGAVPNFSSSQNPQGIVFLSNGIYNISLLVCNQAGCDSITTSIQITVPQAAFVSLGNDFVMCDGSNVLIAADTGYVSYSWQLNGNAVGNNTSTLNANQSGSYSVVVTNTANCTATDTIIVVINNPTVSLGADLVLCNNDSMLITATSGFSQYQWQFNGNIISSGLNTIMVNQQGNYVVIATDNSGCIAFDTLNVIASSVNVTLISDTSFCDGNSLLIDAGIGFLTYQWQLNGNIISSVNAITVTQSGNYFVTVSNANGCTATDNVAITINPLPVIQASGLTTLCETQTTTLTASGALNYTWNPSTYLSSPNSAVTLCSPAAGITYTVTGTDNNGCSNSVLVSITVTTYPDASFAYTLDYNCNSIQLITENMSTNATQYQWNFGDGGTSNEVNPVHYYTSLQSQTGQLIASNGICTDTIEIDTISFQPPEFSTIPNVITPNHDGINDCFKIPGVEVLAECFSLRVFNRWGSMVYESEGTSKCWDGKNMNDADLPDGVYFYLISIKDKKFKGAIHLIR